MDTPKQIKQNRKNQRNDQRVVEKTINGRKTTVTLQPSSIKEALKYGGAKRKRYSKGGPTEPEKTQSKEEAPKSESNSTSVSSAARASQLGSMTGKQYRQEKRGVKRAQKLERIASGKQGDRVDNVIKAVASGAQAAADVAGAISDTRNALKKQSNGGATKKTYKTGGMVNSNKKVSAAKTATKYLGGKSAEPKGASKVTKGRVGGTSKAPKTAKPRR